MNNNMAFIDVSPELCLNIMHRIAAAQITSEETVYAAVELDSHADSAVVGRTARILERTGRKASVTGFTDSLGKALSVEIVHACVMYDCSQSGKSYLIVIRNALHVPEMEECLIHPIMMRLIGLEVDECPKFLSKSPSEINHSIYFPEQQLRIPLKLSGIISYIDCRKPSEEELYDNDRILDITPNVDRWDPRSMDLDTQEDSMIDFKGNIKVSRPRKFVISSVAFRYMDPDMFCEDVINLVGISSVRFTNGKGNMDPGELSKAWNVSDKVARRTIACTTRLCPRNTLDISLNRRYAANDRMLRYRHLPINMYSDTMYASQQVGKSVRNKSCAQVFATDFGWVEAYTMEFEREVGDAFKLLFKSHCVPDKMIMDGARAQVKGNTAEVCKEAVCTIVELERDTPSSNRAERTIGELKSDTKMDMKIAKSPLVFWCYCLERRAKINRSMAKNNFQLNNTTPHSYLTGETTDISNICSFGWFEWVKFRWEGSDAASPLTQEAEDRKDP